MSQARNPHDKTFPHSIHLPRSVFSVSAKLAESKGMAFSEYVAHVLAGEIEKARALKDSLDQVFADSETERDA